MHYWYFLILNHKMPILVILNIKKPYSHKTIWLKNRKLQRIYPKKWLKYIWNTFSSQIIENDFYKLNSHLIDVELNRQLLAMRVAWINPDRMSN